MRRHQLKNILKEDGSDVTRLFRAVDIRKRTTPPLPTGYVGNGGACTVRSEMTVKELEESGEVVGGVGERQREGLRAGYRLNTGLDFVYCVDTRNKQKKKKKSMAWAWPPIKTKRDNQLH
ncbi:hypothetical protein ScalyP_jg5780 [Parmales sp. scaly parma]|nr:hypothetical protein ScalyP_jg5780 [Parmales sp. scaly parma]